MSATHMAGDNQATCCGQSASNHASATSKPADVTCKRCLKVMAKNARGEESPHQKT